MSLSTTEFGKAFEFACLSELHIALTRDTDNEIQIIDSEAFRTAQKAFNKAQQENKEKDLLKAASAAVRVLLRLEPQLQHGKGIMYLIIQSDSRGISGDVRDIVCVRNETGWEMGISCKHNHHAVKHSRLSDRIDFGSEWLGVPCSSNYFSKIVPIFGQLRQMRDNAVARGESMPLWDIFPDKADRFYVPILNAFLEELEHLAKENPEVPRKLIQYLIGRYDFYKVIDDDRKGATRVEAINIAGTLNESVGDEKSIVDVPKLKLPSRFYHMGFVPGSKNTVEIVCDEGWTLTMRIHNASSRVEPSLKFDVQLISLPTSLHAQVEPW